MTHGADSQDELPRSTGGSSRAKDNCSICPGRITRHNRFFTLTLTISWRKPKRFTGHFMRDREENQVA